MVNHMKKTTLLVPDQLMRRLKAKAANEKRTMSSLVEEAVQRYLAEDRRPAPVLPPLPVYDGGGFLVDVASRDALADALDGE